MMMQRMKSRLFFLLLALSYMLPGFYIGRGRAVLVAPEVLKRSCPACFNALQPSVNLMCSIISLETRRILDEL